MKDNLLEQKIKMLEADNNLLQRQLDAKDEWIERVKPVLVKTLRGALEMKKEFKQLKDSLEVDK